MATQVPARSAVVDRLPGPRSSRPRRGWGSAVGLMLAGFLLLVLIVPFAAAYHVNAAARTFATAPTDVIVVLGAARFDGTPSPVLRNRLDHAKGLQEAGVAPAIITVGGNQPGDRFTEGGAGRDYLTSVGADPASVVAVEEGRDTLASLTAVAHEMSQRGWHTATIVSDPAHMARSLAIAERLGIKSQGNPTNAGPGTQVTSEYLSRETVGYLYFEGSQQWSTERIIPAKQD